MIATALWRITSAQESQYVGRQLAAHSHITAARHAIISRVFVPNALWKAREHGYRNGRVGNREMPPHLCEGPIFNTRVGLCCGLHEALVCNRCGSTDPAVHIVKATTVISMQEDASKALCPDPYHLPKCPRCGSDDPKEVYATDTYDGCDYEQFHKPLTQEDAP